MTANDIIIKKRGDGLKEKVNTKEEIEYIINNYVKGNVPDYQLAAYLMAIYFNGMTVEEVSNLTEVMLHSGDVIDLTAIRGNGEIFVDKHSTGGVGDKISLPLIAVVAASGVRVPMMAGRALGYTGGTLDKLESIEGYRTNLSTEEFKQTIEKCGFAIMGQTETIAPADRLLYSLRDVTGTVESIPLITSSILSKKIAEGSDAFCFDVKCGSGAFMKSFDNALALAESLVNTVKKMGKKAIALITDMNMPLGKKIGNWLEIEETLDALEGKAPTDVTELTLSLAAHMINMGGKASSYDEALNKATYAISSGKALEMFLRNVEIQGGNVKKMLEKRNIRRSKYKCEILASQDGFIESIDALSCGKACVKLGVGREKKSDNVYYDSGITLLKTVQENVKKGDAIMTIYGKDNSSLKEASFILKDAIKYSEIKPNDRKLIYETII